MRYIDAGRDDRPPDLADSLVAMAEMHDSLGSLARPPANCRCLIEGYAAPGNAAALRAYLTSRGAEAVSIVAADLYDLPAAYAGLGVPHPPMEFIMADVRDLSSAFLDASADVLVQDFLLNCVPHVSVDRILAEAKRVLDPDGTGLFSFTDDQCLSECAAITIEEISRQWGISWNSDALRIADVTDDPETRERMIDQLGGHVIVDGEAQARAFVTRPHGRFEFFAPLETTLQRIAAAGLRVVGHSNDKGRDDHGLLCRRHRVIVKKAAQS